MRNLTVKRNKTFVGCAVKLKVYIEDADLGETEIGGVRCRKLGDLKNGEEKTFEVFESAAKVFVIADGMSKNFCNDFYALPEGVEDISLSGRCRYNPANGNAFRFDNNDNPDALANRKKGNKVGLFILIGAALVGFVIGLISGFSSGCNPKDKNFSVDGMTITLTEEFEEVDVDAGYNASYGSEYAAVFVLKEEFTLSEGFGDYTVEEYAELLIYANEISNTEIKKENGLTFFEYDGEGATDQKLYRYCTYVFKASDAFWMVQFAIESSDYSEYTEQIAEWASSVKFD